MDRKGKRENPNTQVDKQGKVKFEAVNSEQDDLETQNQMEHVDETDRNIAIFQEDEFRSTGFISNLWKGVAHAESNSSESIEDVCEFRSKIVGHAQMAHSGYEFRSKILAHAQMAHSGNGNSKYANEVSQQRMSTLSDIMEALTDDNIIIIGVYGPVSAEKATLLDKVLRRANRDNLFDMVVMASVSKKPDLKRIQRQIADAFGLTMEDKNIEERAARMQDRIKMEEKILVILQDLCEGLDLKKLGIPFGANHTGCKILLTSTSEEILSSQMHAQKVFMA